MEADQDQDGKISFEEFKKMVENTDVSMSMTLGMLLFFSRHELSLADTALDILTIAFLQINSSGSNSDTRGISSPALHFEFVLGTVYHGMEEVTTEKNEKIQK
jgi:hypothetical protein